jgi:hypothetical protein
LLSLRRKTPYSKPTFNWLEGFKRLGSPGKSVLRCPQ